jgi:hypothetical protein
MDRTQFPRHLFERVLGLCKLEALLNLCDVSESIRPIVVREIKRRLRAHSAEFCKVKAPLGEVREAVFDNLPDDAFVEALVQKMGQACEECRMRWSVLHHPFYHVSLCLECLRSDAFVLVSPLWLTKNMWLPRNELALRNLHVTPYQMPAMTEELWKKISASRPDEARYPPMSFVPLREARRISRELFGKAEDPAGRRARQAVYVKYRSSLRSLTRSKWYEIRGKGLHPSVAEGIKRDIPKEDRRRLIRETATRYYYTHCPPPGDAFYLPYVPEQPTRCFAAYGNPTIDWLIRWTMSEDEFRRHISLYCYSRALKDFHSM